MPTNDVFRFASLRGLSAPGKDALVLRFVTCDITPTDPKLRQRVADAAQAGAPITPILLVELPKATSAPEPETEMARLVQSFRAQSKNVMTLQDLQKDYPALYDVYLWYRDTNPSMPVSPQDLAKAVDDAFAPNSLAQFVTAGDYFAKKLRLWEALLAEYIAPTEPMLLERLQDMIRWFWIFERLQRHELTDSAAVYQAMHATVVLPAGSFHSKPRFAKDPEPAPQQPDRSAEHSADETRFNVLAHAAVQIEQQVASQDIDERTEAARCPNVAPPPTIQGAAPRLLAARYVEALDATTHAVLDDLRIAKRNGIVASQALAHIAREKETLIKKYDPPAAAPVVTVINGRLVQLDQMCHHYPAVDPCAPYKGPTLPKGSGIVRPPGVADLKVIKTTLLKYEPGEIAHIENVLKGEVKIREFNTLRRNEETIATDEETTSETEKDTQATDRFEMEREMSTMLKENMKVDAGVKVSANFGSVSLDSHVDFAYEREREESNKTATRNAREFVNKAVSRVVERRRTQKSTTTFVQTEDKNSHTLSNDKGTDNVQGVYYWLDKFYLAKVVNYGKRLMFDLIIPEPAAFYIHAKTNRPQSESMKVKPAPPMVVAQPLKIQPNGQALRVPLLSYRQITTSNYAALASAYGAVDVTPPPEPTRILAESFKCDSQQWDHKVRVQGGDMQDVTHHPVAFSTKELHVPSGYVADRGLVTVSGTNLDGIPDQVSIMLGKIKRDNSLGPVDFRYTQLFYPLTDSDDDATREDDLVPFAIWAYDRHDLVANVEIICVRTARHFEVWQKQTFEAIQKAYEEKLQAYLDWVEQQKVAQGVVIEGSNPDANRVVERQELKKHCLEIMSGQRFETFDAMRSNVPDLMQPEFSFNEADAEGAYVRFFETAFEWEQMTYVFYPYFWGRKPLWVQTLAIDDPDPIFTNFLRAGAARVLVPTRPGFEKTVVHYFASNGKIWNGGDPPIPGDPLWISVVDEIKEQQGQFDGGEQEGEPWIFKLPTSLVYLAKLGDSLVDNSAKYPKDVSAAQKADLTAFS
jgi:hypothetical protein